MIEREIRLLKYKKDFFLENVSKFNKKAAKHGVAPMIVEFGEEKSYSYFETPEAEVWGTATVVSYIEVTVKYEIPKIDGWDLVCVFDYENYKDADDETIEHMAVFTNAVPNKEVPVEFQNKTEIHCEHCGHNRYRVKSYLVQHENGEYKEVGSTCLKDFLGHDPSNFLFFSEIENRVREFDDEFGLGAYMKGDPVGYNLNGILSLTNAIIRKFGWISRGEAYDDNYKTATADRVLDYLHTKNKTDDELIEPTDEDRGIAEKVLEYFNSLDESEQTNDYIMNCLRVIKLSVVPDKRMGIACSMIQSYRRYLEKKLKEENELPSNWFGEVGDKVVDLEVTCVFKTPVESYYGTSMLYKFVADNGDIFKTFYSGYSWDVEQGEKVLLRGTVKKHDEWNDKKETLLKRCNVKALNQEQLPIFDQWDNELDSNGNIFDQWDNELDSNGNKTGRKREDFVDNGYTSNELIEG